MGMGISMGIPMGMGTMMNPHGSVRLNYYLYMLNYDVHASRSTVLSTYYDTTYRWHIRDKK